MAAPVLPLCQIAYSTRHLLRTHHWYRRALGFVAAGDVRRIAIEGPAPVPDLPESFFAVWCLVDRQDFFQIEMFEFERPRMRPVPEDWRPSDIGFSMVGIHVSDFDEALDRLGRTSGRPLSDPMGERGRRRVCLRDPDGILLELMEDFAPESNAHPNAPVAIRSVTISVGDLARARRFWIDTLGFEEASNVRLHAPEHEALWGMPGARRQSLVVRAGAHFIELVQYEEPLGRPRPAGYLLSDQGILNVALGTTDRAAFDALYARIVAAGYRPNCEPWTKPDVATVVYVNDDQGFSVELLCVEPRALSHMGFVPSGLR